MRKRTYEKYKQIFNTSVKKLSFSFISIRANLIEVITELLLIINAPRVNIIKNKFWFIIIFIRLVAK